MTCATCHEILSEGLDLCIRARKMDAQDRANASVAVSSDGKKWEASGLFAQHATAHNEMFPDRLMLTKSATIPLWVQEQYETDLAEWERKARKHLIDCAGA